MGEQVFWAVWNPERSAPTYRHDTQEHAVEEAKRLARMNPGEDFYVLRAVAHVIKNDCLVTRLGADGDDGIPF